MALKIAEEAGLTDVGRQRQTNEDRFFEAAPLFAVADGMGGARSGEVASQIAVEEFAENDSAGAKPEERLASIAHEANRKIYELAQSDESHAGMGTTLTAALVGDHEISLGHVGDSRAYRFRDDELERLTQDHSLVEELMRMGRLSPEDAEVDPRRSIITRALGPEPTVEVETCTIPAKDGDVYLLCSDGLTGMVSEERVAEILRARSSLEQAARDLVTAANENGGKDNITVVLFKLVDEAKVQGAVESDTLSGTEQLPVDAIETPVGEGEPGGDTVVMPPADAEATRARAATATRTRPRPPTPDTRHPTPARAAPTRRRARWPLAAAVALIILIAAIGGLYAASRELYFVGTDNSGLITLYRGVPYDLPLGIHLYTTEYESTVPAAALPPHQRDAVLNHRLRGHGDAVDLIRSLERSQG
ncbi:MAG TPA: Stp1/IreP family PP2C-type Ser/Thr phosphatase [Thermoleophilaceae bacterium]|nr:Stp1/IreP family PP2C-type Ser/Thr phosphatase [Thermoleophilaceae bacterium]